MPKHLGGALTVLAALALWAAPAVAQPDGAWFEYRNSRRASGTGGVYVDWGDELLASGRYDVAVPADPSAPIVVHGVYHWRYTSPESHDAGQEDRTVAVERAQRRYVDRTDLDEYDDQRAALLATWVFVPTTLGVGDEILILDESFHVEATDARVTVAGAERTALHLVSESTGDRHDAYGTFSTSTHDEYWFDAATGMFLRETRVERDDGQSEGQPGALTFREEVAVVDASYAPHVGSIPPDPLLASHARPRLAEPETVMRYAAPLGVGATVLAFLAFWWGLRPRRGVGRASAIGLRKLGPEEALPVFPPELTIHFLPFLRQFVDVARRTGNDVWLASEGGRLVGLAIDDHVTRVPTIFARDAEACERLRKQLGRLDFFSEVRHGNLPSVVEAAVATGEKLPASTAYNVLETYEVLALEGPGSPAYDAAVVSRLEDADVAEAAAVLTNVLGAPCEDYLKAALAAGDLAYVARDTGKIVGVGLASAVGSSGRLHTLVVHPEHRNRGLGRELVRARIRAMSALGVTRILTEIAATNAASLELARGEGLASVGQMYVESSRETKTGAPGTTVRR